PQRAPNAEPHGGAPPPESDAAAIPFLSDRSPSARTPPPALVSLASSLKAIQLYDSYLVLETAEGMLVIDQHALHERILFEQLKARLRAGPVESQRLLIPEPVELSAEQAARTLEHQAELLELGLGVEDFGGGTVLL